MMLAVGSADGRVHVFSISQDLKSASPCQVLDCSRGLVSGAVYRPMPPQMSTGSGSLVQSEQPHVPLLVTFGAEGMQSWGAGLR